MPPALDRLLASSSALRLLRFIVNASEVPAACSVVNSNCCASKVFKRNYSKSVVPAPRLKWTRWRDAPKEALHRNHVRHELEGNDSATSTCGRKQNTGLTWDSQNEDASWAATLAQQERLKRLQGIRAIWKATRFRDYRLPVDEGPDARFLWGTFIKNPKIVRDVIQHAAETLQHTGKTYPYLYEVIMTYWLPRQPQEALVYHHEMQIKLDLKKIPLLQLLQSGRSSFQGGTYEILLDIYRNSNERDVYNEVVPTLIEKGYIDMARRWHNLCTFRSDLPSETVGSHPVVKIFITKESAISTPRLRFRVRNPSTTSDNPHHDHQRFNQELLQKLLGRDAAPVRFEDAFCARMFATRAFPPASIIQGLAMVGVNEIGPQTVLAMAARTIPIEELPLRFEELRSEGVALKGCVFSLALEKFAMEGKWHLVRSMVDTDQHPDVFGEAGVQRRLLEYYLSNDDYMQAQRTLAILTLFHNDTTTESWNLLLQTHVKIAGPQHIGEMLQDMRMRKIKVTKESINEIKTLLRPRHPGKKPGLSSRGRFDDLRFVTRIYMTVLDFDMGHISHRVWPEIIRRFGMLGRFRELRRLLLWLLHRYAPPTSNRYVRLSEPQHEEESTTSFGSRSFSQDPTARARRTGYADPIRRLFPPSLQQGLIVWGFRAALLPNAHLEQSIFASPLEKKHYRRRMLKRHILERKSWSIGLRFLVQLRDLGVLISSDAVVKALQGQFLVLFGRGQSKRKENRIAKMSNTKAYAAYVKEVNQIWGTPLIADPESFSHSKLLKLHAWHPRLPRQRYRKTSISLRRTFGPHWQEHLTDNEAKDVKHGIRSAEETHLLEEHREGVTLMAKAAQPTGDSFPDSESTVTRMTHDVMLRRKAAAAD